MLQPTRSCTACRAGSPRCSADRRAPLAARRMPSGCTTTVVRPVDVATASSGCLIVHMLRIWPTVKTPQARATCVQARPPLARKRLRPWPCHAATRWRAPVGPLQSNDHYSDCIIVTTTPAACARRSSDSDGKLRDPSMNPDSASGSIPASRAIAASDLRLAWIARRKCPHRVSSAAAAVSRSCCAASESSSRSIAARSLRIWSINSAEIS